MSSPDTSAAAAALNRERWGNRVVVRAATTVINRIGELPADLREVLHEVTEEDTDD